MAALRILVFSGEMMPEFDVAKCVRAELKT